MIRRCLAAFGMAAILLGAIGAALTAAQGGPPQVPDHFRITEFVDVGEATSGFYRQPTAVSVGPDGRLYVALLNGRIYAFEDTDGDDRQDTHQLFASGLYFPADIAWREDTLYVVVPEEVHVLQDLDGDGVADSDTTIIADLPDTVRGLTFDNAGRMYLGVAADCDSCAPPDPRQGSVLRLEATEPYTATLLAMGLHDPEGLAFFPGTDDLFATDDGRDDLGPDAPPDELNRIQEGENYGWPHCWEGGADDGWEIFCTWSVGAVITFPAHSSPASLVFHDGTAMPSTFANAALVALRDLGEVRRVTLTPDGTGGYAASGEPFATGFEEPVDVTVGPDGAIYVADYAARKVYCIRALPDLSESAKQVSSLLADPGERLTYTLSIAGVGPTASFTLTDTLPPSTTYVAGSAWASAGTITQVGGMVHWWGVVSANTTLTAGFAVQVAGTVPTPTTLFNTAVLSSEQDPTSPYTLQALTIVGGRQYYLPVVLQGY